MLDESRARADSVVEDSQGSQTSCDGASNVFLNEPPGIANTLDRISKLVNDTYRKKSAMRVEVKEEINREISECKSMIINELFKQRYANPVVIAPAPNPTSYSTVAAHADPTALKRVIQPQTRTVTVKMGDIQVTNVDLQTIEKKLAESTQPTSPPLASIIGTRTGTAVLKFSKEGDISHVTQKIEKMGYTVKLETLLLPTLSLSYVPAFSGKIDEVVFNDEITKNNEWIRAELDRGEILKFLYSYPVKSGDQVCTFRVSPVLRKKLMDKGQLKYCHRLCLLKDVIKPRQCARCARYGHSTKACQADHIKCGICSENHIMKDCPNKTDYAKHSCSNCQASQIADVRSQAATHSAFSNACPSYKRERIFLMRKTDWANEPPDM
jgi:hypothetical protein